MRHGGAKSGIRGEGKERKVVSEAEGIKGLNARAIGGDAAGFERVWKVFELLQWRTRARKRKAARGKKERKETTRARLILNGRLRCNEAQPLDLDLTAAIN